MMSMGKVHRVLENGKNVILHYRLLPYDEIAAILKEDGAAFFETTPKQQLKRSTVWKAAKKLSAMMNRQVTYSRGVLQIENGAKLDGYLFVVSTPESQTRKA
jgi:hypothetical protein